MISSKPYGNKVYLSFVLDFFINFFFNKSLTTGKMARRGRITASCQRKIREEWEGVGEVEGGGEGLEKGGGEW